MLEKLTSTNNPQSAALQHHKLASLTDRPTATISPHHTPVLLQQKARPHSSQCCVCTSQILCAERWGCIPVDHSRFIGGFMLHSCTDNLSMHVCILDKISFCCLCMVRIKYWKSHFCHFWIWSRMHHSVYDCTSKYELIIIKLKSSTDL